MAAQLVLDVTVNVVEPALLVTLRLGGDTLKEGAPAAWVRVTTTGVRPATVTVMFAVRGLMEVLAA